MHLKRPWLRRRFAHADACAEIRFQHIDIHLLRTVLGTPLAVLAPAPTGAPQQRPVRRPVARARVLGRVDEALDQPRMIAVATLEMCRQHPQRLAEHPRGQVVTLHHRTDQKPAQAHHPMQVGAALRLVPPYPALARGEFERRAGKTHRPQPAMRRAHQVAKLVPGERRRSERMLTTHQLRPHPAQGLVGDFHQLDGAHLRHLRGHRERSGHGGVEPARTGVARCEARCRQLQRTGALEFAQRLEGGAALGAPPGVAQLEALTHLFGERSAVRGLRRKQANLLKRHGRTQRTLDEVLGFHASHRIEASDKCSALDVGNGQA